MALLDESTRLHVKEAFAELINPVRLVMFTQGHGGVPECQMCADTRMLVEEVSSLSEIIQFEVRDIVADAALAEQMQVDKIPAIAVLSGDDPPRDYGIRLYGIPAGFEFSALIEDLLLVSQKKHGLSTKTLAQIGRIREPIHLQVISTPTCPHCPRAVLLAHRLALASEKIRSDMIEAMEFPHLVNRYQVSAVPLTVVNEVLRIEGALPEEMFVERLLTVLDPSAMAELKRQWDDRSVSRT
jgi:glutaredoxin-like protein